MKLQNELAVNSTGSNVDVHEDENKKVIVTHHATEEAMNDFRELKTYAAAKKWVSEAYKNAEFIDDSVLGTDGAIHSLYCYENAAIIVEHEEDEDVIITVYKLNKQPSIVKSMVQSFLSKELKKIQRKEVSIQKRNNLKIAELEMEKAECQLKAIKTKSESVKKSCYERISAIGEEIAELNKEMFEIKRMKTQMAKGLVAYA